MDKSPTSKVGRFLIVYKKSSYQEHAIDEKDPNYLRLLKERNIVTRRSKSTHDVHLGSLETVRNHLKHLKIPFDVKLRYNLKPIRGYDLVITIGGDGTFLETSHYLQEGLLMGINSVPNESVGHYCRSTSETFLEKMYQYLAGILKIQTLHRLAFKVDGKEKFPLALNDVLFTSKNPAGTTRYVLEIGHRREEQKSSGIWICPAPGSTAATHSAGGTKLPINSKKIEYVVREPYAPPRKKYHLIKDILGAQSKVEILSMMDDACLFVDGPHMVYPIQRGACIEIMNAHRPLQALW